MNHHDFAQYCGFETTAVVYQRTIPVNPNMADSPRVTMAYGSNKTDHGYELSLQLDHVELIYPTTFVFDSLDQILLASSNPTFLKCAIWVLMDGLDDDEAERVADAFGAFPEEVEKAIAGADLTIAQVCDLMLPTFGARILA